MRIASNADEFVDRVRNRTGVEIEVISGEEESRLAYLAVKAGVGLAAGRMVVFDTGGGSSQFTFGRGERVEERFSVNVGAVRLTERFGLAGPVSAETLADAMDAIGSDLARLDARPRPDELVALGGVVTNLAAVMHTLARYDPDVVQGTTLDRTEIDRQIELFRTRTADERRGIIGLQPGEPRSCSRAPASCGRRWRNSAASRSSSATEGSGTACCSNASTRLRSVRLSRRRDDAARLDARDPARTRASTSRPIRIDRPPPAMRRLLPIVEWLPRYERVWLRGDVVAGIAVTALIVPKNLGYAGIAGVPLQNGLYAAAAGALIYAVFCTSRQISTGPSSSLAAVAGGAVLVTGLAGEEAAQLVAATTLLAGLLYLLLAAFRSAGSPSSSRRRSSRGSSPEPPSTS